MIQTHFLLLVEDSDDDAFFFGRALARAGLGVQSRHVKNGQEAIDYLLGVAPWNDRRQFPFPHAILLDLKMPVCNGFDFLTWKRGQLSFACLPAIVMSSSRLERDIRRSYELGAHSFTTKVNTTESLCDRISALRDWWFKNCVVPAPQ